MAKKKPLTQREKDSVSMRRAGREAELELLRQGVRMRSTVLSKSKAELTKQACRKKGRAHRDW
jgi:hypothetical protein